MLWKPVPRISVVRGNAQLITLIMPDDVFFSQSIELTEVDTKLHRFFVNGIKIRGIGQAVLANFKTDVCIIR
jgi:hypothetical protein